MKIDKEFGCENETTLSDGELDEDDDQRLRFMSLWENLYPGQMHREEIKKYNDGTTYSKFLLFAFRSLAERGYIELNITQDYLEYKLTDKAYQHLSRSPLSSDKKDKLKDIMPSVKNLSVDYAHKVNLSSFFLELAAAKNRFDVRGVISNFIDQTLPNASDSARRSILFAFEKILGLVKE